MKFFGLLELIEFLGLLELLDFSDCELLNVLELLKEIGTFETFGSFVIFETYFLYFGIFGTFVSVHSVQCSATPPSVMVLFPNMHSESLALLVYFLDKAIRKFGKIFNFTELFEQTHDLLQEQR